MRGSFNRVEDVTLYGRWLQPSASTTIPGSGSTSGRGAATRWMMSSARRSAPKNDWRDARRCDHARLTNQLQRKNRVPTCSTLATGISVADSTRYRDGLLGGRAGHCQKPVENTRIGDYDGGRTVSEVCSTPRCQIPTTEVVGFHRSATTPRRCIEVSAPASSAVAGGCTVAFRGGGRCVPTRPMDHGIALAVDGVRCRTTPAPACLTRFNCRWCPTATSVAVAPALGLSDGQPVPDNASGCRGYRREALCHQKRCVSRLETVAGVGLPPTTKVVGFRPCGHPCENRAAGDAVAVPRSPQRKLCRACAERWMGVGV